MIAFLQLTPAEDLRAIEAAIGRVIARGWFVLGPELEAFESSFADACEAPFAVGVGTGTDALAIGLRALGIGPGDEVITSPLSAAYSALAIVIAGARPVFADIDPDRLTLDPQRGRGRGDVENLGDHAGASLRAGCRHAGDRGGRGASWAGDSRGLLPGTRRDGVAGSRWAASAGWRPTASTRRRTSAHSATAERSRRPMPTSTPGCDGCATAARRIAIITPSSA